MTQIYDFSKPEESTKQSFVSGLDLINMQIDSVPMLIDDLLPQVGVCALVGASDTCKSMLLRQLAMCNVSGSPFLGKCSNAIYKRSIVVCSEDDEFAISYLLRRQNKSIGLTDEQASRLTFLFDTENFIDKLIQEIETNPADLIVIDAFGDLFDGRDLNQNNQVRTFLNKFSTIANKYKCCVVFLHHTGKRTEEQAPSKNNAIGSQGFEAKMRLVIELRLDASDDTLRHFCVVKGNYLPQSEKQSSHVIKIDENLTFTSTGTRVPFDELVSNKTSNGTNKKVVPENITEDTHTMFIENVFKNKKQFTKTDLTEKCSHFFMCSEKPARRFISYYEDNGFIKNVSKNKNSAYELNI